ncbi:MAG TPA: right-handed parallel beta-helix repeat-containing protein [Thermoanaerobaculia bacterium]|nr:right-handed parallel beta-helix repeat-containing protein [Thermoanaerobaculia bacterium]
MKSWKRFAFVGVIVACLAAVAPGQVLLVGTGDPAIDVPAVQAAVDGNGVVLLEGTFSFTGAPAAVTIHRSVWIAGVADEQGQIPRILGGTQPFVVLAPGADVAIEGLRFQDPVGAAVWIQSAHGILVESCVVDGVVPGLIGARVVAIGIFESAGPVGTVRILRNDVSPGGPVTNDTNGIILLAPTAEIEIAYNNVSSTTAHGIDLRNVAGLARVERNVVVTGPVGRGGGVGAFVDGIRCVGTGRYVIEDNFVSTGFENAAGIRIGGTAGAAIQGNDVLLPLSETAVPGAQSAGIQVEGSASSTEIVDNRVRGRGRTAFSVIHSDFALDKGTSSGNPADTRIAGNDGEIFAATVADVEIGEGAANTEILGGSGTVSDRGTGTVILGGYLALP